MKFKRLLAVLLTVAMTGTMLAGCSGQGGNETSETISTEESVGENVDTGDNDNAGDDAGDRVHDAGVTAADVDSVVKDLVNVGISADPGDLSPWSANNTGRTATMDSIYQSLGHCIDGEIYGVLMKEYEMNEDETSMVVTIYDTIYDTEGNHMTADDVVFSFEKCVEGGSINGLSFIDKCEAVGDYEVQFDFADVLYVYDIETLFETVYMVTQASYEASGDGMATSPVSTGQYKVTDYVSDYILTLEKTNSYWQEDASLIHVRDMANVEKINFYVITESSQMTMALEDGSIDMSWQVSADDLYMFQAGGEQSNNFWVYQTPDNLCVDLFLNCSEDNVGNNVDLRKAVYYAVNNQTIADGIYGGYADVMYDTARISCPDYNMDWQREDNYYQYDVEKAKEYLASAGYAEGEVTLKLMVESTERMTNLAAMLQAFLLEIGINTEIQAVQSSLFNTYAQDPNEWDMLITQKSAANYAVTNWKNCYSANYFAWGGSLNFVYDDEFQEVLNASRLLSTHSDETVNAVHDYIIENAYGMGMVNFYDSYVVPNECTGITLSYRLAALPGACTYTE